MALLLKKVSAPNRYGGRAQLILLRKPSGWYTPRALLASAVVPGDSAAVVKALRDEASRVAGDAAIPADDNDLKALRDHGVGSNRTSLINLDWSAVVVTRFGAAPELMALLNAAAAFNGIVPIPSQLPQLAEDAEDSDDEDGAAGRMPREPPHLPQSSYILRFCFFVSDCR